ncbi:FAD-dependent oxidoreductase [Roseinatronobacter sp. NSM]|uniref:FAD-dependent oxidoreductase n=1 Tax=Roseinatronobacter sp. NSM TaxID=3457785 RepID=UPI0040370E72
MSLSSPNIIHEPAREVPVFGDYEVVVAGGGPAGIAAALAAGRAGRKVILIERYGFLGGAGTAAGLSTFCGLHSNVRGEHVRTTRGVADDILGELNAMEGLNAPHLSVQQRIQAQAYDISAYKIAVDKLLLAAGVTILYHAYVAALVMEEQHITAVFVETKEGRRAIRGSIFVDGTGDGDLAAWAGAPYDVGDGQGDMLYPTTMYRINGVDPAAAGRAWEDIPRLMAEEEARTGIDFPRKKPIVRPQRNPIEWRANLTQIRNTEGGPVNGLDARQLSHGEIEGRKQCWDTFRFIKKVTPGFSNAYIVEIAPQIGIRETRRVIGPYLLSEQDILGCADFSDSIGVNGWPVEAHVSGDVVFKFTAEGSRGFNQIPYRILLPQGVGNLLVAGRCASMTHEGQSSARVTGPCFIMGEAAGVAADLALGGSIAPADIDIAALQKRLSEGGAFLGDEARLELVA